MPTPIKLSKADARRALVRHHFTQSPTQIEVFRRLKSIQFDPIAPVGCNHDLVLQARVPGYKIGDWMKTAYQDRLIYDGWDKMASLVPIEGWPIRRFIHDIFRPRFEKKIFEDHKDAVEAILKEITKRGPMMPKDFEFQQRREEWKISWYGPSVTKNVLRALWHTGQLMTAGRKNGQHLYDLTERLLPQEILDEPRLPDIEAKRRLMLERHQVMGILRPNAAAEVWSYQVLMYDRKPLIKSLLESAEIVPVDVEGMAAHATPSFLTLLDQPSIDPRTLLIAPLDPFMWDRKMVGHIFDFDYAWEIYMPGAKRRWGYYVLPILYGDKLVARTEFYCRKGELEMREWHTEASPDPELWASLERALRDFTSYCSAKQTSDRDHIDPKVKEKFLAL